MAPGMGWDGNGSMDSKLMRANQPQAKFHLKWYLNNILLDFFDPKSESELSQRNQFQWLKKRLKSSKSIDSNQKLSIYIKNGQKRLTFD